MAHDEDVMGLAFLVGAEINDIKQKGDPRDSKGFSAGLIDPRELITKVAQQDAERLKRAALQEKAQREGKYAPQASQPPPPSNPNVTNAVPVGTPQATTVIDPAYQNEVLKKLSNIENLLAALLGTIMKGPPR